MSFTLTSEVMSHENNTFPISVSCLDGTTIIHANTADVKIATLRQGKLLLLCDIASKTLCKIKHGNISSAISNMALLGIDLVTFCMKGAEHF